MINSYDAVSTWKEFLVKISISIGAIFSKHTAFHNVGSPLPIHSKSEQNKKTSFLSTQKQVCLHASRQAAHSTDDGWTH